MVHAGARNPFNEPSPTIDAAWVSAADQMLTAMHEHRSTWQCVPNHNARSARQQPAARDGSLVGDVCRGHLVV
jgi:hypothetical protein